jgi:hypothetical protein
VRDQLVVYEPFRSIFYTPQFVALYGGHFATEGFDVDVRTSSTAVTTTSALIDGTARELGHTSVARSAVDAVSAG